MQGAARTEQLQIRVTPAEKSAIARAARAAGIGMSAYVLSRVLPDRNSQWRERLRELQRGKAGRIALAELSAWLAGLGPGELRAALDGALPSGLSDFQANYVAAMVEQACATHCVEPPQWTRHVLPLARPAFASDLASLRLHLLANSPPAFRRRNLFVDSSVGAQV
jgi:hypothetical protein